METQHHLNGKRRRSSSPHSTATSTSSTRSEDQLSGSISSPASPTEEEDMAYCLILLAQGHGNPPPHDHEDVDEDCCRVNKISSGDKAGLFVYDCKTCNRSFASFQALGGHRASHKKPKPAVSDHQHKLALTVDPDPDSRLNKQNLVLLQNPPNFTVDSGNRNKSKVRECSICGSEFSSGQALGGHMRRHRVNSNNQVIDDQTKPRNLLGVDLNLPAPEESKFRFPATQQALAFSAPTLVDCYY